MASDKKRKLAITISALQARWGRATIRRLGDDKTAVVAHIATGFPELDQALGIGGIPRGRISEIIGVPTSGMATLALKIVAHSQAGNGTAVYVDPDHIFDPDYAARCGVDLRRLILVHPRNYRQAIFIAEDFVSGGGVGVLVVGVSFQQPAGAQTAELSAALARLLAPLGRSDCALLFLTALPLTSAAVDSAAVTSAAVDLSHYPDRLSLPGYTAVRLLIQRERWLYGQRDIRGYQAQVQIVKNKLGRAGQQVSLAITFKEEDGL
jgi:recombination protein RecA